MSNYSINGVAYSVDAKGFENSLTAVPSVDGVTVLKLTLSAEKPMRPDNISISFTKTVTDTFTVWSPKSTDNKFLAKFARGNNVVARTACGAPVISLVSKNDENCLCTALSDGAVSSKISVAVNEWGAPYNINISLFTELNEDIKDYTVYIRLDYRKIPFYKSVTDVSAWWDTFGYKSAYIPASSKYPLYSTWYSFHQKITSETVAEQCKWASTLGMKNVILDDGWQCENSSGGYAYCGDWEVFEGKIPSMRSLAETVHSYGMKFMIWFSVPFVGRKSKIADKFKGMYLNGDNEGVAYVLDPRFKEVREHLCSVYANAVKEYNLDGLKLDFIDSFRLSEYSSTDFEKMDCVSVAEGVEKLLSEVTKTLKAINPEILIEFRQDYIGPVIRKYGNMMRVADCPGSALTNRVSGVDVRLVSGDVPVHSDMVVWNRNETPEASANQIINLLFTVPQISVKNTGITDEQEKMLAFYLNFWNKNSDTLINGELIPEGLEANYSAVSAKKDGKKITALYSKQYCLLEDLKDTYIVNGTGKEEIIIDSKSEYNYTVFNCMGHIVDAGEILKGMQKLNIPLSGMVEIYK